MSWVVPKVAAVNAGNAGILFQFMVLNYYNLNYRFIEPISRLSYYSSGSIGLGGGGGGGGEVGGGQGSAFDRHFVSIRIITSISTAMM